MSSCSKCLVQAQVIHSLDGLDSNQLSITHKIQTQHTCPKAMMLLKQAISFFFFFFLVHTRKECKICPYVTNHHGQGSENWIGLFLLLQRLLAISEQHYPLQAASVLERYTWRVLTIATRLDLFQRLILTSQSGSRQCEPVGSGCVSTFCQPSPLLEHCFIICEAGLVFFWQHLLFLCSPMLHCLVT